LRLNGALCQDLLRSHGPADMSRVANGSYR
jgi:hypothetical protein